MSAETTLSQEQLDFLAAHEDIFEALWELAETDEFRAVFGEMALGEMLNRYEASLEDEAYDPELRKRYEQIKRREAESGIAVDWNNDLDTLESRFRR